MLSYVVSMESVNNAIIEEHIFGLIAMSLKLIHYVLF